MVCCVYCFSKLCCFVYLVFFGLGLCNLVVAIIGSVFTGFVFLLLFGLNVLCSARFVIVLHIAVLYIFAPALVVELMIDADCV